MRCWAANGNSMEHSIDSANNTPYIANGWQIGEGVLFASAPNVPMFILFLFSFRYISHLPSTLFSVLYTHTESIQAVYVFFFARLHFIHFIKCTKTALLSSTASVRRALTDDGKKKLRGITTLMHICTRLPVPVSRFLSSSRCNVKTVDKKMTICSMHL